MVMKREPSFGDCRVCQLYSMAFAAREEADEYHYWTTQCVAFASQNLTHGIDINVTTGALSNFLSFTNIRHAADVADVFKFC